MKFLLSRTFIEPVIIALVTFFLCYLIKKIVKKIFFSRTVRGNEKKTKTVANLISNIIVSFIGVIGFILILQSFGIDTASFVASLGVFSLVIGLALQDILKDILAGMFIIFEGQYSIGDWVEINSFKGEVVASSLRTTRLRAFTGETKIIANRQINEIINYSLSKSVAIVDVHVAYDSDINKVKEVITNLSKRLISEKKLKEMECLGVEELDNSSVAIRIIARVNHSELFTTKRLIKEEILKEFNDNNIEIPYQQVVIHNGKKL